MSDGKDRLLARLTKRRTENKKLVERLQELAEQPILTADELEVVELMRREAAREQTKTPTTPKGHGKKADKKK
jgi:hypothetical protein